MPRRRVSVAVICDGRILMIRETPDGAWALPGGGVEPEESLEQAALRETWEEAGVAVRIARRLFGRDDILGSDTCFLAEPLGEADSTPGGEFTAAWHPLESMKDDPQVSRVIATLTDD